MLNPLKRIFLAFQKIEDFLKGKRIPRLKKKRLTKTQKTVITIAVIAAIVFLIYFFGVIKPTCYDKDCFNKKLSKCSPVKYTKLKNNNMYNYKVSRSLLTDCKLQITMERAAPGSELDIKEALEGKSMKCKVPKHLIKTTDLDEFENLIDYCTGPLKEGMYKLMLQRMYGLVVTQMGDIVKEVQKTITQI